MASEDTTGGRDRLSNLPVELLERIFELAYEGEDTTTGAISRALLPFVLHSDCPPIQRLAFSSFYARVRPPSLASLAIVAPPSWTRPWEPSLFRHLASSLTSLALTVHVDDLASPDTTSPTGTLPFLTSLVLAGADLDCPAVRRLLEAGPNLSSVTLRSSNEEQSLLPVLPFLPTSLNALRLETPGTFDHLPPLRPCDSALSRFAQLEELHLGQSTFDPVVLGTSISTLSALSILSFGPAADIQPDEVVELLSGAGRLPSLRTVILDVLPTGKRGYRAGIDGAGLHPQHDDHPWHIAPDWEIPPFSDPEPGFLTTDVTDLVVVAFLNGVKVKGTAVDGIEVFRAAQDEVEECLLLWAEESGERDALYGYMGAEAAEARLRERRLTRDLEEEREALAESRAKLSRFPYGV